MEFQDALPVIDEMLGLYRSRWTLADYPWEDVAQDIRIRIHEKWDKYDQTKQLKPWVATVIQHFISNELRDRYYIYQPPCLKCEMNLGANQCKLYGDKLKKCTLYKKFQDKKSIAANLYFPVSYEQSNYDAVQQFSCSSNDLARDITNNLSGVDKQVFHLFYISGYSTTKIARNIHISGCNLKQKMEFVEKSMEKCKGVARDIISDKRIIMGFEHD